MKCQLRVAKKAMRTVWHHELIYCEGARGSNWKIV